MKTDAALVCRYLGLPAQPGAADAARTETVCEGMEAALTPLSSFRVFPLFETEAGPKLGETGPVLSARSARRLLKGCDRAALLTVTLGFAFEALLRTASGRDMAEAVILDACASAYLETAADEAEEDIRKATGAYLTDRFSPGYGDLPLSLQPAIVRLTDAEKRLGVHVLDSYQLTPSKTVTALIGMADTPRPALVRGCAHCAMNKTCPYRKGDGTCEAQ